MVVRGCQQEDDPNFLVTTTGDTIYKQDVNANWTKFRHESDSVLNDADIKLTSALRRVKDSGARHKVKAWSNIIKAEQLIERLGEKHERGELFEQAAIFDEKELQKMETYKQDYKKLEATLTHVLREISANAQE